MIGRVRRYAILITLIAGLLGATSPTSAQGGCQSWDFCLYIPAFDGPDAIGLNVATVLNLRTWKTFRRKPWPDNPRDLDFGSAGITWDTELLPEQSHQAAERRIESWTIGAQMVLWGRAYPYGSGVAVQPRLSLPLYNDGRVHRNEVWNVTVDGQTVEADLPARRYELPPILLDAGLVERYRAPTVMTIYRDRQGDAVIGRVGSSFVGEIIEADKAQVRSDGVRGWIRYPGLGSSSSGVVDFIAGLIRIYRADWGGAASALGRVLENPAVKPRIALDARLLRGMARERDGRSGRDDFATALRLDPDYDVAVRYLVMADLSRLASANVADRPPLRARISETLDAHLHLFSTEDPWLIDVRRITLGAPLAPQPSR